MSPREDDSRHFGLAMMLGQTGVEMVAPIGAGVLLDRWLGTMPWLTITGAVVGFVGGLGHMIILSNRLNRDSDTGPKRPAPDKAPPSGRGGP
jgi:F0F1-type ATP synthase assembly protein I